MRRSWTRDGRSETSREVDHVGAARQIEDRPAGVDGPETRAANRGQCPGLGQPKFPPGRSRPVAARSEDARIEPPAIHAHEKVPTEDRRHTVPWLAMRFGGLAIVLPHAVRW